MVTLPFDFLHRLTIIDTMSPCIFTSNLIPQTRRRGKNKIHFCYNKQKTILHTAANHNGLGQLKIKKNYL